MPVECGALSQPSAPLPHPLLQGNPGQGIMEGRGRRWAGGCGTQWEGGEGVGKRGLLALPGVQWGLLNVTNGAEWGEVACFHPHCPQSPWGALSLGQSEDSEP